MKAGNSEIIVIGVSENPKVDTKRGFLDWMDHGFFNPNGLKDLTGYLIEVQLLPSNFKKTIGDTNENVAGTLWKVAQQDDQYLSFSCGGSGSAKSYLAFDVFRHDKADPIARV